MPIQTKETANNPFSYWAFVLISMFFIRSRINKHYLSDAITHLRLHFSISLPFDPVSLFLGNEHPCCNETQPYWTIDPTVSRFRKKCKLYFIYSMFKPWHFFHEETPRACVEDKGSTYCTASLPVLLDDSSKVTESPPHLLFFLPTPAQWHLFAFPKEQSVTNFEAFVHKSQAEVAVSSALSHDMLDGVIAVIASSPFSFCTLKDPSSLQVLGEMGHKALDQHCQAGITLWKNAV